MMSVINVSVFTSGILPGVGSFSRSHIAESPIRSNV